MILALGGEGRRRVGKQLSVRLLERRVAVPRRLVLTERLLARGKLSTAADRPPEVLASATLRHAAATAG